MKNLLFIFGLMACVLAQPITGAAQYVYSAGANTSITGANTLYQSADWDSLEADGVKADTFKVTGQVSSLTFQFFGDKIDGDLGGNIVIEGSLSKSVPFVALGTLQLLDLDTSYSYTVDANYYLYYRTVISDTSATHNARYKTFIGARE